VDPEDPSFWCFISNSMGELDSQLRFAAAGQLSFERVPELGLPNAAQAD